MNQIPETATLSAPMWYERDGALLRVVSDLMAEELMLARPGRARTPLPWSPGLDLARDLGADSLDLLGLSAALADFLHLQRSGRDDRLLANTSLGHWMDEARSGLRCFSSEVTFRTSGSSGSPKRCTHAQGTLWQEVVELAHLFAGSRRILSAVPAHHIYGFLFTVLLPQALGIGDDEVLDLRASSPAGVVAQLREGDLVVGHPEFWRAVAQLSPQLPPGVVGVTSTSPCPDGVADALRAAGLERLVQVYGSSETAGVGWRDAPRTGFRLFSYWSQTGDAATLERQLPDGSRTACELQDKLEWTGPELFLPAGRIDHAVQVAGTNVFPAYVADVLAMHPAVREASVRLMRADEGNRLKAFVVPRDSGADVQHLRATLADWVAERLAVPERPAVFSFGPGLPRKANGKPADWIIDAWA